MTVATCSCFRNRTRAATLIQIKPLSPSPQLLLPSPPPKPKGRDLRIMDPSLTTSYPSAILCRDKAMVVNLEHIKVCVWGGLF